MSTARCFVFYWSRFAATERISVKFASVKKSVTVVNVCMRQVQARLPGNNDDCVNAEIADSLLILAQTPAKCFFPKFFFSYSAPMSDNEMNRRLKTIKVATNSRYNVCFEDRRMKFHLREKPSNQFLQLRELRETIRSHPTPCHINKIKSSIIIHKPEK